MIPGRLPVGIYGDKIPGPADDALLSGKGGRRPGTTTFKGEKGGPPFLTAFELLDAALSLFKGFDEEPEGSAAEEGLERRGEVRGAGEDLQDGHGAGLKAAQAGRSDDVSDGAGIEFVFGPFDELVQRLAAAGALAAQLLDGCAQLLAASIAPAVAVEGLFEGPADLVQISLESLKTRGETVTMSPLFEKGRLKVPALPLEGLAAMTGTVQGRLDLGLPRKKGLPFAAPRIEIAASLFPARLQVGETGLPVGKETFGLFQGGTGSLTLLGKGLSFRLNLVTLGADCPKAPSLFETGRGEGKGLPNEGLDVPAQGFAVLFPFEAAAAQVFGPFLKAPSQPFPTGCPEGEGFIAENLYLFGTAGTVESRFRLGPTKPVQKPAIVVEGGQKISGLTGPLHFRSDLTAAAFQFGHKGQQTGQLVGGSDQPLGGLIPLSSVDVDAEKPLQMEATLERPLLDHFGHLSLADEGETVPLKMPASLEALQILKADFGAVEEECPSPCGVEAAPQDGFPQVVAEMKGHFGLSGGPERGATLKNEVLLAGDAETAGAALAQDPAEPVEEVALAAPVRTDDGREARGKRKFVTAAEAFKVLQVQLCNVQRRPPCP
jgi:hypothetical protein